MKIAGSFAKRKTTLFLIFLGAIMIGALVLAVVMTTGSAPDQTVYSKTSNQELKLRASRVVRDIRELVYDHKKRDRQMVEAYEQKSRPESRQAEKMRLREQWIKESDATHDSFMRAYKEKYWADAILLRRELLRRLGKAIREPQQAPIYQHPTNVLGVEAIADNLELLAKSLPEG
jgi:hypothetical protein